MGNCHRDNWQDSHESRTNKIEELHIRDIDTMRGIFFIWSSKNCKTIPDLLAEGIILLYSHIYVIVHLNHDLYAMCTI